MDAGVLALRKSIEEASDFTNALKSDSEKRFADFFSRIQLNVESIRKLNKQIDEHKHF